jgi:hypothetical protein
MVRLAGVAPVAFATAPAGCDCLRALAHRAFCASAIFRRDAAEIIRIGCLGLCNTAVPFKDSIPEMIFAHVEFVADRSDEKLRQVLEVVPAENLAAAIPSCNRYPNQYQRAFAPRVSNPWGRDKGRHQPIPPPAFAEAWESHCVRCSPPY